MLKQEIIFQIIQDRINHEPLAVASAFAPANIALCKYWGKRNVELNLPFNSSLSIALHGKGAFTTISINSGNEDEFWLNNHLVPKDATFGKRLTTYLNLFRGPKTYFFKVATITNLPVGAGLASSAAGFAALVLALDQLFTWQLDKTSLSILARLGSGSACRSLWDGWVEWQAGEHSDGMDSFAHPLPDVWPDLRVGLLLLEEKPKSWPSTAAMQHTVKTANLYATWPAQAEHDLIRLKQAIVAHDFAELGMIAEKNARLMHNTMLDANPPIDYTMPVTLKARELVQNLRNSGTPIYFTQDAGPNLKLLFLANDCPTVLKTFPEAEIIVPFQDPKHAEVTLVDESDQVIGYAEKLSAHQTGQLHRAFSVFIVRQKNQQWEILLQRRALSKYHSGGLWSNACCSHPLPYEKIITAAERRLQEEMGFLTRLKIVAQFQYRAHLENGLIENELDHVLLGNFEDDLIPINKNEVMDYRWMKLTDLKNDLVNNPQNYTPWLAKALDTVSSKFYQC